MGLVVENGEVPEEGGRGGAGGGGGRGGRGGFGQAAGPDEAEFDDGGMGVVVGMVLLLLVLLVLLEGGLTHSLTSVSHLPSLQGFR